MKTTRGSKVSADFRRFMKQRAAAAAAYVRGDFAPLARVVARRGPGTFFGPGGGAVNGAAKVAARYERDAHSFAPVGKSRLQILQMGARGDLGYWVGVQRATAQIRGMKRPVPMNLRVTEIFRREGRTWKMIQRHADGLVTPAKP